MSRELQQLCRHLSGTGTPALPHMREMIRGGPLRGVHGTVQGFGSLDGRPVPLPGYADNAELRNTDPTTGTEYITTPLVTDYARRFFECPMLHGAALEDDGGNGTAGEHWETRVFQVRPVCCALSCVL
jgi:Leishmanolysin